MIATLISFLLAVLVMYLVYYFVGKFITGVPLQIIGAIFALILLLHALRLLKIDLIL